MLYDAKGFEKIYVAPGYTDEIANIIKTELSVDIDIRTLRSNHLEKI